MVNITYLTTEGLVSQFYKALAAGDDAHTREYAEEIVSRGDEMVNWSIAVMDAEIFLH